MVANQFKELVSVQLETRAEGEFFEQRAALKTKNLRPRNTENEGTNSTVLPKTDRRAGLILLLAEKSIPQSDARAES